MNVKIFISYRRADVGGYTHALYFQLEQEFGRENVFLDVAGQTPPGSEYRLDLKKHVRSSDVLLAVIGPDWMDDVHLSNPHDVVRFEIEVGLEEGKRIIPVLIGATPVPAKPRLPPLLQVLPDKEAVRLTHDRFGDDCRILIKRIRELPWQPDPRAIHTVAASLVGLGAAFAILAFLLLGGPLGFAFIFLAAFFSLAGLRTYFRGLPKVIRTRIPRSR